MADLPGSTWGPGSSVHENQRGLLRAHDDEETAQERERASGTVLRTRARDGRHGAPNMGTVTAGTVLRTRHSDGQDGSPGTVTVTAGTVLRTRRLCRPSQEVCRL